MHFDTIKTGDVIAFATSCDTSSAVMDKFHEAVAWAGKGVLGTAQRTMILLQMLSPMTWLITLPLSPQASRTRTQKSAM